MKPNGVLRGNVTTGVAVRVTQPQGPVAPHTLDAEMVAALLGVQPETGLSNREALERLSRVGANRLPQVAARSRWRVLLAQFKSILILILLGAVVLAALIGSTKDALVILAVVVINALVGFYQEYRAERSLAALKSMLPSKARVRRDGVSHDIAADDVVPGDILLLEAGDRVAADGRLWLAAGLEIDESALTGESLPAGKRADIRVASDAPLGDRLNLAYMNTLLTRGRTELAGHALDVDLASLLVPMVACNDSRFDDGKSIGDPMEAALLVLAAKGGILRDAVERTLPRLAELPFDSAHKFMATFHRDGDQIKVFVKGAPDVRKVVVRALKSRHR